MKEKIRTIIGASLYAVLVFLLTKSHPFFWDTIQLASKQAHWFFENNFQYLLLPNEIDSGHPPFLGIYLAVWWSILGKSLWVSHLSMVPFHLVNFILLFKLAKIFVPESWQRILPFLILLDPVCGGQSLLIGPDIMLTTFFLLGFWAIETNKPKWKLLAILFLGLISMRAMMIGFALFLYDVFRDWERNNQVKQIYQKLIYYLPGGILALAFLVYHFIEKGWIGYHESSPWAPSFERVNFDGFLKNIAVVGWRFMDLGRFVIWFLVIYFGVKKFRLKREFSRKTKHLLLLLIFLIVILTPTAFRYNQLSAHRYFLPIFLVLSMLAFSLFEKVEFSTQRRWVVALFVSVLSGNLWVYPRQISQDWDATLSIIPYYEHKKNLYAYLEKEAISLEEVGTVFPEIGALKYKYLSDQESGFKKVNLTQDEFVFFSNIMNDFSDEELKKLEYDFELVKKFGRWPVYIELYKKNN